MSNNPVGLHPEPAARFMATTGQPGIAGNDPTARQAGFHPCIAIAFLAGNLLS
jgi:hypothetical protein